jgi:hypothetical protein
MTEEEHAQTAQIHQEGNLTSKTGQALEDLAEKVIPVRFAQYEVLVRLGEDQRFLGIEGINISKSFLSQAQKVQTSGFHDVEDLYEE